MYTSVRDFAKKRVRGKKVPSSRVRKAVQIELSTKGIPLGQARILGNDLLHELFGIVYSKGSTMGTPRYNRIRLLVENAMKIARKRTLFVVVLNGTVGSRKSWEPKNIRILSSAELTSDESQGMDGGGDSRWFLTLACP